MNPIDRWETYKAEHPPGTIISGRVARREPFGFFLDIGESFYGLVDIINVVDEGSIESVNDFPPLGEVVRAVIFGYSEQEREVGLGIRKSDFQWAASVASVRSFADHREGGMSLENRWRAFVKANPKGNMVSGVVIRHEAYGYFVDIGEPFLGLVSIVNVKDQGKVCPADDFPACGEVVKAVVLDYTERKLEVRLGTRESDFSRARCDE